ncbi:MAG: zinc metallopeptidase [Solirubrobacteraceae bacterium]|nr:zinc metallopeptidase [Solirubrobacteraceae bacterium]
MYYWLIFTIPPLLLGLYAQAKVKSTFAKYSQVRPSRGISGADAAAAVLQASGLPKLSIEPIDGHLTDHYDPRTKTLRLSADVGASSSIAALGVAAHEAGHAIQDAHGYLPMRVRQSIVPLAQLGSSVGVYAAMGGLILAGSTAFGPSLFYFGIALFSVAVLFQLVTLPVEFDASRRALIVLEQSGLLAPDEVVGAKKVLNAAALTYVAGFLAALGQLLYFVMAFAQSRD